MTEDHPNDILFWKLAEKHLARPEVVRSTMMGRPCLRANGNFYGAVLGKARQLVVKLPEERVQELIAAGVGSEFKPAGKVFREWLSVAELDRKLWRELLDEACAFGAA